MEVAGTAFLGTPKPSTPVGRPCPTRASVNPTECDARRSAAALKTEFASETGSGVWVWGKGEPVTGELSNVPMGFPPSWITDGLSRTPGDSVERGGSRPKPDVSWADRTAALAGMPQERRACESISVTIPGRNRATSTRRDRSKTGTLMVLSGARVAWTEVSNDRPQGRLCGGSTLRTARWRLPKFCLKAVRRESCAFRAASPPSTRGCNGEVAYNRPRVGTFHTALTHLWLNQLKQHLTAD
jgi:hypothetical protein